MIELLIRIEDELYEQCKDIKLTEENEGFDYHIIKSVANGTVLPKGHGRLKDVDWIDDNCENHYSDKDGSWCYTWRDIDNAPTIIEAHTESE